MTGSLKPCPFCGGEAVYSGQWAKNISCSQCNTYLSTYKSRDEDFSAWNNRIDLVAEKRAGIVNNVRACPICGSFRILIDTMQNLAFCPECGLHHGLGSLYSGAVQEVLNAWNRRVKP